MEIINQIYDAIVPARYGRIWRTWDFIRYDIPNFLKNVWVFRAELTRAWDWDSMSSLSFMKLHLSRVADYLEVHGNEVPESRLKKVEKIRRAVKLLDLHIDEKFIEWAEQEMGETLVDSQIYFEKIEGSSNSIMKDRLTDDEKAHNGRIYNRAQEIAKDTWLELFEIIRGQDLKVYSVLVDLYKNDEAKMATLWDNWFDGSGIKHWWD
jgi:hypothetical protein